jgi:hypothetical protein
VRSKINEFHEVTLMYDWSAVNSFY